MTGLPVVWSDVFVYVRCAVCVTVTVLTCLSSLACNYASNSKEHQTRSKGIESQDFHRKGMFRNGFLDMHWAGLQEMSQAGTHQPKDSQTTQDRLKDTYGEIVFVVMH